MTSNKETVTVRVRIAGEEHPIKGQASKEYIEKLARIVDNQIKLVQKKNPNLTRHRMAILAAINLADELERLRAEYNELLEIVEDAN
ncbi:MAG: cell division protein ZapA [Firmicutes bacterium]|nr:cell division protein ZapA [Bacillota bacterium]